MILGHERQIAYLERAITGHRMSHAYLFYGPERVGKRAIAYAIARLLLCPNRAKTPARLVEAGDDCHICKQIDTGAYRDVIVLGLADTLVSKKETRKEIPIEDIRELKRRFAFAAAPGAWRIAIIDGADRMSAEASDAFLKLLEEPGSWTLFILVAPSRDALPATIVSRATPVGFSLLPDRILAPVIPTYLKKEDAQDLLAIAGGRAGILMECMRDPAGFTEEKKFMTSFTAAFRAGIPGILLFAEKASGDEATRERALYTFIAGLRRKLASAPPPERSSLAQRLAHALDLAALMQTTNVNPRLLLDVMFVEGTTKKP